MSEIKLKPCPFFVVYDSHGEIDHADCFVERIMKAVDA